MNKIKIRNIKAYYVILLMLFNVVVTTGFIFNSIKIVDFEDDYTSDIEELKSLELASENPKTGITGTISDRNGKIFSDISVSSPNRYINRYQSDLDVQPSLFLQDWNITRANMMFTNLDAVNYTKDIETDTTEFIYSSIHGPIYFYQKFSVELSQYVNNVSVFIQDINNPTLFTDENSWEVAILNCSNDNQGSPNVNNTLGLLQKPHPIVYAAHWEVFDYKNSDIGAIYLDVTKTNWTVESGTIKYWFAMRIKIPPDDSQAQGGPKFLYFSPDGEDPNDKGEGDTFAINPSFFTDKYYTNHAVENVTAFGNHTEYYSQFNVGNLSSFVKMDNDRYFAESNNSLIYSANLTQINVKFYLEELSGNGITYEDLSDPAKRNEINWWEEHYRYINNFNISYALNCSIENIFWSWLYLKNNTGDFVPIFPISPMNKTTEDLFEIVISDPYFKLYIINNYINFTDSNSITFQFFLADPQAFNTTINQLTVRVRELPVLNSMIPHDPLLQDLNYASDVSIFNGTSSMSTIDAINSLNTIDKKRYNISATTTNVSIEFKFNVLSGLESSIFNVTDLDDWVFKQPNPIVPQIDIRITSNVSVYNKNSLNESVLEVYKGDVNNTYFTAEQNSSTWIRIDELGNNSYAFNQEITNITYLDPFTTWIFMQLVNVSDDNSIRFRLRYVGNETFQNFNVSINEFALIIYVQNAISSDITSKLGFGLNSNSLKPSDIHLKNFGAIIPDNGLWEMNISNGIPTQGFYYFNVTSIWPAVRFDVSGNYTIEKSQNYNWEYLLAQNNPKILWNVSADIVYYSYYSNIDESRGLQFNVPLEWLLIEVYNSSSSPPTVSGGWYWTIQSNNIFKTITLYNISDGFWKIGMNSSMSILNMNYSATGEIKIDQIMVANASIPLHYGGEVNFEVYSESSSMIFSDYDILNETALENSTYFKWNVLDTTSNTGKYYLKTYWVNHNQTHAFLSLDVLQINVSKWASNFTYIPLPGIIRFGQDISLDLDFSCENSSISFEGFPVKFSIKYSTLTQLFTKYIDTNYETSLNYTIPDSFNGNLNITILFDGNYRIDGYIEEFSLDIEEKLGVNIEFVITPDVQYLTGTYYFSVKVTDELDNPLESVELIFKLLDGQNNVAYEITTRSNEEGIASASLNLQNLGSSFTIQVSFAEKGIYASAEISSESLRVINEFTRFMESFIQYLPFIILGIVVISTFITVRYIMKSRKRRVWADDATVLDDLVKISYILIISKEAGLSIYHKQISFEDIDSDLISGFLQAISAFKSEIKKSTTTIAKRPGFEMDYVDFKIVITDGAYVRVALVLEGTPSEKLKENQWLFTDKFEERFTPLLKDFDGDITPFKQSDDLVEKYFNITLIYPLKLGKHYGVIKLKGLEKDLVEMAAEIQKERKVFFISSLLNLALAARKASRDEIISTILSLREKELIIPVE